MTAFRIALFLTFLLSGAQLTFGLAQEQIGPDKDRSHPTTPQLFWPRGMVDVLRHDSRVYSIWVNGNENIYFNATPDEIAELIKLFSEIRLRDHLVVIKKGPKEVGTFKKEQIAYNVHFHYLDGIALAMTRRGGEPETYDPTLTIHVDPAADLALLRGIAIPDKIILKSEIATWPNGKAAKPKRRLWHTAVHFEDGKPAADFEGGVFTTVTMWEKNDQRPLNLGRVDHQGGWNAAFSDQEIAHLKGGTAWLSLTVGNYLTEPKADDLRLELESLSADPAKAKPITLEKPGFYYGRLLFDDGTPPRLDPEPWPGAEITLSFPYAGRVALGEDGYFKAFFTPSQLEDLKSRPVSKNIYIPNFGQQGRSTARYAFPASELSMDKESAGELRIAKPRPEKKEK